MWNHHFIKFASDNNLRMNDEGGWLLLDQYLINVQAGIFRALKFSIPLKLGVDFDHSVLNDLLKKEGFKFIKISESKLRFRGFLAKQNLNSFEIVNSLKLVMKYLRDVRALAVVDEIKNCLHYDLDFVERHKKFTDATWLKTYLMCSILLFWRSLIWLNEALNHYPLRMHVRFYYLTYGSAILIVSMIYFVGKRTNGLLWFGFSGQNAEKGEISYGNLLFWRSLFFAILYSTLTDLFIFVITSTSFYYETFFVP